MRVSAADLDVSDVVSNMDDIQIQAFWSKVNITDNTKDCWEWQGARTSKGYGNVRINKKYIGAHRVAFELAAIPIPDGLIVCHVCDNPRIS